MKVDKFLDWDWKETFWCYWITLSILLGLTLGTIFMIINKLYHSTIDTIENKDGLLNLFLEFINFFNIIKN